MQLRSPLLGVWLLLLAATGAAATAPAPRKVVEIERFAGRWYELARTPNDNQKDCWAATIELQRSGRALSFVQTCRRGTPDGPTRRWRGAVDIIDAATGAKLRMSFFAGLLRQEYWVLDRADDYSWAVVGTPGGNYVWLFSRKPGLAAPERDRLLQRVRDLGYDTGKLQFAARADARSG